MRPFSYMKTARGIYLNIEDSDYATTVGNITFVFSSLFYLNKFTSEYQEEIDRFNIAINNVYKNRVRIIADQFAMIRLYLTIEKRGFYILIDGVKITCVENLNLHLLAGQSETTFKNLQN